MSEKKALKAIQAIIRKATKDKPLSVTLYLIRESTKQGKRTERSRAVPKFELTPKGKATCQN